MLPFLFLIQNSASLPGGAAYSEPDPEGVEVEGKSFVSGWMDQKQRLVWYGEAKRPGKLSVGIRLEKPTMGILVMILGGTTHVGVARGDRVEFGSFPVTKGPVRATLAIKRGPGPEVRSLECEGDVRWAKSLRRNAASVHLRWPTPKEAEIVWFTNEATMRTDPQWSYTMACGFARGYFGMQVNSPTERRIIFSVWDAGDEAVDRAKVDATDRVALVAKGPGVIADSFGNEGTGGHSHLVFPWKTGSVVRFLVGCRTEGDHTLYAGYFKSPGDRNWRLVAAFRVPKDGKSLRDLYSFSEDFVGANGQKWRESVFGNGWIGLKDGTWLTLTKAVFTTDGHGKTERWDTDAFVRKGRFHLRHGGFVSGSAKYGDTLELTRAPTRPRIEPPVLPK